VCYSQDSTEIEVTPNEILVRYVNYITRFDNVSFQSDKKIDLVMPDAVFDTTSSSARLTLTKDAIKIDTFVSSVDTQKTQRELLINQGEKIRVQHYLEENRYVINADNSPQSNFNNDRLSELSEKLFWGYEFFDSDLTFISDYLTSTNDLILAFDKDDDGIFVLRADSGNYNLKIWFEDINNGVPQKLRFERNSNKTKMYDIVSLNMEIIEFQNTDGISVPRKMKIVREKMVPEKRDVFDPLAPEKQNMSLNSGYGNLISKGRRVEVINVEWSNVSFSPQSRNIKMESLLRIPNGTPVHMKNSPQIEYVWMDGKPVVKTDEVALAIARSGHKFMPGPNEPRFWLISIGLLLFLFGGGVKTYQYFKNRSANA